MDNLNQLLTDILLATKAEHQTGPVPIKISKKGNWEPEAKKIEDEFDHIAFQEGFVMRNFSVLHDDDDDQGGFTRITCNCLDMDTLFDYISNLEKKVDKPNEVLKSALNKAITMLDDYNNMFGDQVNKTQEITDLDEILKLH